MAAGSPTALVASLVAVLLATAAAAAGVGDARLGSSGKLEVEGGGRGLVQVSSDGQVSAVGQARLIRRVVPAEAEKAKAFAAAEAGPTVKEDQWPTLGESLAEGNASLATPAGGQTWKEGKIPYWIDNVNDVNNAAAHGHSGTWEPDNAAIKTGIANWEKKTCLRFIQCATRAECKKKGAYIRFWHSHQSAYPTGSACHANMGQHPDGETNIALPDWCVRCSNTPRGGGLPPAHWTVNCDSHNQVTDRRGIVWYTGGVEHEIGHVLNMYHTADRDTLRRDSMWYKHRAMAHTGVDIGPFNPGDASIEKGAGRITDRDAEFIKFLYGDCSRSAPLACITTVDPAFRGSAAAPAGRNYPLEIAGRSRETFQITTSGVEKNWALEESGNSAGWMKYGGVRIDIPVTKDDIGKSISVTAHFKTASGKTTQCSATIRPEDPCSRAGCVNGKCVYPGACVCRPGWVGAKCNRRMPGVSGQQMGQAGAKSCAVPGLFDKDSHSSNTATICSGDGRTEHNSCYNCANSWGPWQVSPMGTDLKWGEWDGSGWTSLEQCKAKATAAGAQYFAWTGKVYAGYCKVQKASVMNPDLTTHQGYGFDLWEACGTWRVSPKGTDLKKGENDGSGWTSFEQCKAKADAAGARYFAWTSKVYGGYCKVQKASVRSPDLTTHQGYGYKLWEKNDECATNRQWMCADCFNRCGQDSCANALALLRDTKWQEKRGHCETYSYMNPAGTDLSVAQLNCALDPNCKAVGHWGCPCGQDCSNRPYLLCGAQNYKFTTRYGTGHCLREKDAGSAKIADWTGPGAYLSPLGKEVCEYMKAEWKDGMCYPKTCTAGPTSCYGHDCDFWTKHGYSCSILQSRYGCNCAGCARCKTNNN